jgi:hypothetical protein
MGCAPLRIHKEKIVKLRPVKFHPEIAGEIPWPY